MKVLVTGVPRAYQSPTPGGYWLTEAHKAQIKAVSPQIELIELSRAEMEALPGPLPGIEVVLIEVSGTEPYGEEILLSDFQKVVTPDLRWIQTCSAGVTHLLYPELIDSDIIITHAGGVHRQAIAESVMAAMLFHVKQFRTRLEAQAARQWRPLPCEELGGKTVCIVGLGHIGQEVARLSRAFRMRVVGVKRHPHPVEHVDQVCAPAELHALLPEADFLVIAAPLTAETEGMIGPAEFASIKRGAYLINVARGKIVQEEALLAALRQGQLSGAYLDAHHQEPLPPEHPLWAMPQVFIIPHDSHASPFIGDNIVHLFCQNLRRYLSGQPLLNVVDKRAGY